jgi:hypothetical protein
MIPKWKKMVYTGKLSLIPLLRFRFKDDVNLEKELFELLKKSEKDRIFITRSLTDLESNFYPSQFQALGFDQKNPMWQNELKDPALRNYMMDYNNYDPNMKFLSGKNNNEYNLFTMKQANSKMNSYLFENPNLQYKLKGFLIDFE